MRWALAAGVLLSGFGAAAQDGGGANVRFEQLANSLTIRAKIYKNDGDRNIETGEILAEQTFTATQGGGIPITQLTFSIVTVCALDFLGPPSVTSCPAYDAGPVDLPRFFVDKSEAIGIKSVADGTTASQKRINRLIPSTTPAASAERMQLIFNCTNALCGPSITSGRLILNRVDGTPRTIFLYPILVAGGVGAPIMVNPGGANPPGITATLTSGKATIDLSDEALAGLPAFNGFQIGAGSENARFTFRLADMTFARAQPDFVGFGCRIDLTQTNIPVAFKLVLPATSSEKFCPASNGGVLKLNCSGQLPPDPPYTGGAIDTSTIECLISGSQCGRDEVFPATVKSIKVSAAGFAELACEATIGG